MHEEDKETIWSLYLNLLLLFIEQAEDFLERGWNEAIDAFMENDGE